MALSAAGLLAFGSLAGITIMNGWARWNFLRLRRQDQVARIRGLMTTAASLEPGRIHWEYDKTMNDYGSPMALMLFPYWTEEALGSTEGLFFESSLSTPFHFLNQAELSKDPSSPIPGLDYPVSIDRGCPTCSSSASTIT